MTGIRNGTDENKEKNGNANIDSSESEEAQIIGGYQRAQIKDMGSTTTRSDKGVIHCLTIVGQIEGHQLLPQDTKSTKYEHVMPQLAAIEESEEIEGLLVLLNTVGGDIEAGLGIAEMIASMSKPTASLVLGGGHSIGVPLAVAAKRSFIAPSAAMTIHPVRLTGVVIGVSQTYDYFGKIQERIVQFITKNSRIKRERLIDMMLKTDELAADVGTIISGQQAVADGLIDQLGGLSEALGWLHKQIEKNKKKKAAAENAVFRAQ
jgi:ATP-dependent protease ClpP protease subunit